MKKETSPKIIKKYPFKFSTLMIVLFVLAIVLCAVGFGLTTWRFYHFVVDDGESVYGWLQYLILYFVTVFLIAIIAATLIRSQYVITEKQLILQFGFIKTTYEIKEICSMHLFQGSNKLTVYFDDFKTKYAIIVIKDVWYHDFIKTLNEINPRCGFSFSSAEEEDEIKKSK